MAEYETNELHWYVVHTYSGYENKVKANLEKIIENRNLQSQIHEVAVPMQNVIEIKNGVRKSSLKKVFPGYVLVKMYMNNDTWYAVRNTRGVTSFVGPGSKPIALTPDEVTNMGLEFPFEEIINFEEGQTVKVIGGPFEGSTGIIKEINTQKQMLVVTLSVFGRETPVELDFLQAECI